MPCTESELVSLELNKNLFLEYASLDVSHALFAYGWLFIAYTDIAQCFMHRTPFSSSRLS